MSNKRRTLKVVPTRKHQSTVEKRSLNVVFVTCITSIDKTVYVSCRFFANEKNNQLI